MCTWYGPVSPSRQATSPQVWWHTPGWPKPGQTLWPYCTSEPLWSSWSCKRRSETAFLFPLNFFNWTGWKTFVRHSCGGFCDLYLCEAQLGCMRGAGTLFSSWIMVSLSVEMVRTLEPLIEPFHLNSPAGVMQNLWERCRLLSWSWQKKTNKKHSARWTPMTFQQQKNHLQTNNLGHLMKLTWEEAELASLCWCLLRATVFVVYWFT